MRSLTDGSFLQFGEQLSWRRLAPAWLLSLTLHLIAMLLGGLLWSGRALIVTDAEPSRAATIVVARRMAPEQTQYLSEDDLSSAETTAAAKASASASTMSSQQFASNEPPPTLSTIKLPEAPGFSASREGLVIVPQPGSGRGRPQILPGQDDAAIRADDAAQRGPSRATGPTAQLSLFGSAEATGWSFVFLIDRSQSMGGEGLGAIAAAARELELAMTRLSDAQIFQVIAYNQKSLYLTKRELIPATAKNKQQMLEFLKNLAAFGATEHELGLLAALRLEPDVLFLFTDGGDPFLKSGQLRTIRDAAAGHTSIHVLHFGAGPASAENDFLPRLAAENRGSYVYLDVNSKR